MILAVRVGMPVAWKGPAGWRIRRLKGDYTSNWRLTFGIAGGAIVNLNLEDDY